MSRLRPFGGINRDRLPPVHGDAKADFYVRHLIPLSTLSEDKARWQFFDLISKHVRVASALRDWRCKSLFRVRIRVGNIGANSLKFHRYTVPDCAGSFGMHLGIVPSYHFEVLPGHCKRGPCAWRGWGGGIRRKQWAIRWRPRAALIPSICSLEGRLAPLRGGGCSTRGGRVHRLTSGRPATASLRRVQ